jgi:hypothetical protein
MQVTELLCASLSLSLSVFELKMSAGNDAWRKRLFLRRLIKHTRGVSELIAARDENLGGGKRVSETHFPSHFVSSVGRETKALNFLPMDISSFLLPPCSLRNFLRAHYSPQNGFAIKLFAKALLYT